MNEAKWKLLELIREPITIKELQYRTGMKWANLSLHLKDLDENGFILQLGKQGKSKVIQINKFAINKFLTNEQEKLEEKRIM